MDPVALSRLLGGEKMLSVWSSLADLPDPRTGNAQRHNLLDMLTIALTATIRGAESCVDFADFARDREALFRDVLELPGGLPSHDTFSRLFRPELTNWPPGTHKRTKWEHHAALG